MRIEAPLPHQLGRAWTSKGLGGSRTLWRAIERIAPLPPTAQLRVGEASIPLDLAGDIVDRPLYCGEYERGELAVAREFLRPGAVVVDVGANRGLYSALAVERGAGRVLAVEPHPDLAAALRRVLPSVEVREVAVGDTAGTAKLHVFPNSTYMSTIREHGIGGTTAVDVALTTLDELLASVPTIDFMKIDVEHLEQAVLRGASETFAARRVAAALVEINVDHDKIAPLLDDWGYSSQLIHTTGRVLRRTRLVAGVHDGRPGNYLLRPA